MHRYASVLALTLTFSSSLPAKVEIARMTIDGGTGSPVEITDRSILSKLNLWPGPGNTINGVPDTHDGFAVWSKGPVPTPRQDFPRYEISFYGSPPQQRLMYVVI